MKIFLLMVASIAVAVASPADLHLDRDIKPDPDGSYTIDLNTKFAIDLQGEEGWYNNQLPLWESHEWSSQPIFNDTILTYDDLTVSSTEHMLKITAGFSAMHKFQDNTWSFGAQNVGEATIIFQKINTQHNPRSGQQPSKTQETVSYKIRVVEPRL